MSSVQPAGSPSAHSASAAQNSLARGSACLPCRRRKMRCDGVKPACGQCVSKRREEDCEYTSDTQGLTRTQLLEENISLLEARIRELENPSEASSVKLHTPQGTAPVPGLHGEVPQAVNIPDLLQAPLSPSYNVGSSTSFVTTSDLVQPEPTFQDIHSMVNDFIPYSSQVGFFLSVNRFVQMAYLPALNRDPLEESLVSAVCLWGSHLSHTPAIRAYEATFLAKAVKEVSSALFPAGPGSAQGRTILCVIQAEVLLANYFFNSGRFLEGRYHCSAAASLAITCRLDTLGGHGTGAGAGLGMQLVGGAYVGLSAADGGDAIAQGEKINAFWAVYVLDKCWSVALGSPSAIAGQSSLGARISTPWPLSMQQYEQGQMVVYTGQPVVSDFLSSRTLDRQGYLCPVALRAKAATLFAQATVLAARYREGMPDKQLFLHEFSRLDNLITAFINTLPQVRRVTPGEACDVLIACTVARVAVIQLHIRFVREQERSRDSCVATANSIVATLQNIDVGRVGFIDPIMAILLSAVCQVFIGEIRTYNAMQSLEDPYVASLTASLDRVLALMSDFSAVCPLMAAQVAQVRDAQVAM
ncbi:hypothetical protein PHLGIDRAFT_124964 [Phlebiopsis gigantea 11061_1 CR5-6]|uniref:Zn(2)-C6 fungal-type domain-containing protein n=1 Tax=Phlebiopsis gigantea (strain 11061_1 CR5-6) TaxID=745531 RepID=A0A0C3SF19_PHLG1|nr:hypothetical protein PHLGIDRAFT_124964 [Phlebiopsis gigantea 11061_1 CR5-6]